MHTRMRLVWRREFDWGKIRTVACWGDESVVVDASERGVPDSVALRNYQKAFVFELCRGVEHRGSDLRLGMAAPGLPPSYPRKPVAPRWWRWGVGAQFDWT